MQSRSKLLVFPTSRAIREYVNSQKEFNTLLPSIITIDELFKKSLVFENKKYLDEDERFLYLKEAVKNVDLEKLGISSSFSYFIKQSDYIYRFFLELSSENVDIESIDSNDTYGFYSEHLQILKQIRKNFLEILDRENFVDRINYSKYFNINSDFIKRYDDVELYFEGYFTKFEFELIKEISKYTNLQISFVYNKYNKKSIEKFIHYGFDLTIDHSYQIDFSNKKIVSQDKIEKKCEQIVIKGFSSRVNQIAFIKKSITTMVNGGIEPSKIALILPDESFTTTISLFDNEGYFNYAMGLNIYNTNLYKTIDAIYSYLNEDEIKNIKNLEFVDCNKDFIDTLFRSNWNKIITTDIFDQIVDFLILQEKNKDLLEKFNELIYKLKKIVFSYEEKIKLKDAFKIFYQRVCKLSLDDVNSGKITVMGLLESRRLQFDGVIICDFNESFIPKRSLKDKFLSTKLKQNSNLPTSIDRENLQKYYYERLINSSKNVYISYVKNENSQISRFANELFEGNIDEKLYDNSYKHILYKSTILEHFKDDITLDIDLSKLTWSASGLKEFLQCKRRYYLNHILKIKDHDISLKPKGFELGNIIHKTLEQFYKQENKDYKTLIDIFNQNRSDNSFLNLELEIWKKRLKEFINLEKQREDEGFINIEQEKPFLIEFNNIKLRGTIDRIDKKDDQFYVIDYKTSSNLKVDTIKNYDKTDDFQLEFYFLALKDIYQAKRIKTFYYDLSQMRLKEEIALEQKLQLLEDILKDLNTKSVDFKKCESSQTCQYCPYSTICNT